MRAVFGRRSGTRAAVAWATNTRYPSRVHLTNGRGRVSLCGFPVSTVTRDRPHDLRVCPDCAMAYVEESFPIDGKPTPGGADVEWFRQLPRGIGSITARPRTEGT